MPEFVPATRFEDAPNLDMRFPPLPRTVAETTKLLNEQSDTPDMTRLVDIVNADPVVSASILRRINSAYYGMRRRIGDIRKAVFLLGFLEVSNMVLTEGMLRLRSVIRSEEQIQIFGQIMRISVGTAIYAHELAHYLSLPRKSTAFTAGLLHSIGRLVLLYNKPYDYEALWWTNNERGGPSVEAERVIFGTDYIQLGSLAADRWQLPEDVVLLIENHRTPERIKDSQLQTLALSINIGLSAAEQLVFQKPEQLEFRPPATLFSLAQLLHVSPDSLVELVVSHKNETYNFIQEVVEL